MKSPHRREGCFVGGRVGGSNSCTHVPACSSSDRARGEGHMINYLPPGPSEHSHHDVGRNGNRSPFAVMTSVRDARGPRTHSEKSLSLVMNHCAIDKGQLNEEVFIHREIKKILLGQP